MSKAEEFLNSKGFTRQFVRTNGISYDKFCSFLDEYAEQESREEAKAFAHWIVMNPDKIKLGKTYYDFYGELYAEFKEQEEKP